MEQDLGDWAGERPLSLTIDREAKLADMLVRPAIVSNMNSACRIAFVANREPPQQVSLSKTDFHFTAELLSVNDAPRRQPSTESMEQRSGNEMSGYWTFEERLPPGATFELGIELHGALEIVRCTVSA